VYGGITVLSEVEKIDYRQMHLDPVKAERFDVSFMRAPYRAMVWRWEKELLTCLAHRIRTTTGNISYLDFACGTGRILAHLECSADRSAGVDISPAMLHVAARHVRRSELVCGDMTRNRLFPDQSFDLVTAFRFFLNADAKLRDETVAAISKSLKDGGYLIFNIHMNAGSCAERLHRVYHKVKSNAGLRMGAMSVAEACELARLHHLEVVRMDHFGIVPVFRQNSGFFISPLEKLERRCAAFSLFLPLSRYVVYTCRRPWPPLSSLQSSLPGGAQCVGTQAFRHSSSH
jgi:SAM-dependent methyltransferase